MKEYRLKAWPDLPVQFRQTSYRRLLSELSQRHLAEDEIRRRAGISRREGRALLCHLAQLQVLEVREAAPQQPHAWRSWASVWRRLARA